MHSMLLTRFARDLQGNFNVDFGGRGYTPHMPYCRLVTSIRKSEVRNREGQLSY